VTGSIEGGAAQPAQGPSRQPVGAEESRRASRAWWDQEAARYQAEHGAFLGPVRLVWGPEGLDEETAGLLGEVRGRAVLEVGSGAGQGARWLRRRGALAVAVDLSTAQLAHSVALDAVTGTVVPAVQADACALPFRDRCFDVVFAAYGALPFVADAATLHGEVARVLAAGGRWVLSVTHPVRWAMPDAPGPEGLTVTHSYFDRTPYAEVDAVGQVTYVEHHRTVGDHIHDLVRAGFRLLEVLEPPWPDDDVPTWGGWSPLRGRLVPGTLILVTQRV
jgi:ubiquinone/menaquinone biosynthesis C-methylase UbiE